MRRHRLDAHAALVGDVFVDPEAGLDLETLLESGTLRAMVVSALRLRERWPWSFFIRVDGEVLWPEAVRELAAAERIGSDR